MQKILVFNASNSPSPYHVLALTDYLASQAHGGAAGAAIVSMWEWRGRIVGFYESADPKPGIYRRISGGPGTEIYGKAVYASLILPSSGLGEIVEKGFRLLRCLAGVDAEIIGGRAMLSGGSAVIGATRLGLGRYTPGVVEVILPGLDRIEKECITENDGLLEDLERGGISWNVVDALAKSYSNPRWLARRGASAYQFRGSRYREGYWVSIGINISSDGRISDAGLEGVFYAAPPLEPYKILGELRGMPLEAYSLDIVRRRLQGTVEFCGITGRDFEEAVREALNSALENL